VRPFSGLERLAGSARRAMPLRPRVPKRANRSAPSPPLLAARQHGTLLDATQVVGSAGATPRSGRPSPRLGSRLATPRGSAHSAGGPAHLHSVGGGVPGGGGAEQQWRAAHVASSAPGALSQEPSGSGVGASGAVGGGGGAGEGAPRWAAPPEAGAAGLPGPGAAAASAGGAGPLSSVPKLPLVGLSRGAGGGGNGQPAAAPGAAR
jgi:hypothetical protein